MSTTVYYEPNKLPAGMLALAVHSMFFALLYFGINWNRQAFIPPTMSVELWQSLPEEVVVPPANPKLEEIVPPPHEKTVEPDIVIPEKKKVVTKPVVAKPEKKKPVPKPVEVVKSKPKTDAPKTAEQKPDTHLADQQSANIKAERLKQEELAAANGRMVDEYKAKIQAKIKQKIVEPPGVAEDASAKFLVTLLPGGPVLKADLKKSSGNAAYDNAVERAIWKSDPLPLPPDGKLFSEFREILMTFKPEKNKNK
jgi:colicin import membrane protein